MSAPPFVLLYTSEAEKVLGDLASKKQYATKLAKVRKALRTLADAGPHDPGLHTHRYQSIPGPDGVPLWESYGENHTPSAWRIWWIHGPNDTEITVITIGPHP